MKSHVIKILVPVDFSNASKNALRYVKSIFKKDRVHLNLLYVGNGIEDSDEIEKNFDRLRKVELAGAPFLITHCMVNGEPQKEILNTSQGGKVDLVVLGIKTPDQILGFSIAEPLLKKFDCPVITVPENCLNHRIDKITYANDHKMIKHSEVFDMIRFFAQKFNSRVLIFHLYPDNESLVEDNTEPVLEYYLESTDHDYFTMVESNITRAINDFVERNHVDLLTVLTRDHGHNSLTSEGKLVYELVKTSNIPMLVLN